MTTRTTRRTTRRQGISIVRIGVIAALAGVGIIVLGVIASMIDRATRQVPLEIAQYPGAVFRGQTEYSRTERSVFYLVQGVSAEDVKDFYQREMDKFYPGSTEVELRTCKRNPIVGNFPEYDRGSPDVIPYQFSCMFDGSTSSLPGQTITQWTRVNISPGIRSQQTEGMTVIEYLQKWQP
jgi:hypothetical protein